MKKYTQSSLLLLIICVACVSLTFAQTNAFTYQGNLTDGTVPANGTYEMQFSLFNAASVGTQIGSTITKNSVTATNGIFIVTLDFGSSPFTSGADRFLEISVKKPVDSDYTTLSPRQQLISAPYSIRTVSAASADALSASCAACVTDAQINTVSGAKITGSVASALNATNATSATSATSAVSVTGTVAIGNGGTGANSASAARTNLGLGTLSTVSPTGTASSSTFLRGDNTWATVSGGNATTLDLVATSTASQILPGGGAGVAPVDLSFASVPKSPSLAGASFDGTTYTVGQTGTYLITVSVMQTGTSITSVVPQVLVDGTTVVYGVGIQNGVLPTGTLGRGSLSAVLSLTANQTLKIKVANGGTSTVPLSTDGSTRLSIVKLN